METVRRKKFQKERKIEIAKGRCKKCGGSKYGKARAVEIEIWRSKSKEQREKKMNRGKMFLRVERKYC